jgi:hypothetical protein
MGLWLVLTHKLVEQDADFSQVSGLRECDTLICFEELKQLKYCSWWTVGDNWPNVGALLAHLFLRAN